MLKSDAAGSPASTSYYETQGGALAMRRAGYPTDNGIFYILSDHLGSSSVILAQDGAVLKRDYYYPYGGNRGAPYSDVTTKRFTGQYHEAGLPGGEGLSFYNARWYDPQLGRFVSADSVVPNPKNPQDYNRYTYARGNPVRFSDPTGHVCYDPGLDAVRSGNCNGGTKPSPTMPTGTPSTFGLTFDGNWSPSQKRTAVNVAIEIELALWRAGNFKGRYVVGATFRAVYGNLTLHSSDTQEYWVRDNVRRPLGARTDDGHNITFFAAGLNASTINLRYNLAHEFGHAFNANALSPDPDKAYLPSGTPYRDLQSEGIWVGQEPIAGGTPYLRTNDGYQVGPNGIPKPYRQNMDWEAGEDFADMFANWAFNSFASGPSGAARGQWMDNHMSSWIGLAVAADR